MSRLLALSGLILACLCWSLSFPLMKAMSAAHTLIWPGSWFISSWSLAVRFLVSAAVLAAGIAVLRGIRELRLTSREWQQALMLGGLTAGGMLLQMDGLSYTQASTSAFLTQFYAVQLPIVLAVAHRRLPHPLIWLAVAMVVVGSGVLAGVDLRDLRLGRGEWETIGAATLFTGQILVAGHERFASNRPFPMTALALATTGLVLLPLAVATAPALAAFSTIWSSGTMIAIMVVLTLVCTLAGMLLMFACQRFISPVVAGVTYCCEPVFASGMAMILPGVVAPALGIVYLDEHLTWSLVVGGALVLSAVVVGQLAPTKPAT
jgi:drug/metabolite transporter (DMT)-like permease